MRFLFLLFWYIPIIATAQTDPAQLLAIGDSSYQKNDFAAAAICYTEAKAAFQSNSDWSNALKCTYKAADCLYEIGQAKAAIALLDKELPVYQNKNAPPFDIAKALLLKGFLLDKADNFNQSLSAYEDALTIYETLRSNHHNVAYAYKQAGQIYLRKLDYKKTVDYFEKALIADSTETYNASLHALLAETHLFLKDYDKTIEHFEKGLQFPGNPKYTAMLQKAGGEGFLKKGNLDKAEQLLLYSLKYFEANPNSELWKLYYSLAEVFSAKKQNQKVEACFQKAFKAAAEAFPSKNREAAKLNCLYGNYWFDQNQFEKALPYYQKAMIQVFPNFNSENWQDNPPLEATYLESWGMTAPARKALALRQLYARTGDLELLKNAAHCFDLSLRTVDIIKRSYSADAAKLYLGEYVSDYVENALETNFLLFEKTSDRSYADRAFRLMEQAKADVLRDAVQRNKALIFSQLPDSLLKREESLRQSIADKKQDLAAEQLKEAAVNEDDLKSLRNELFDLEQAHERLLGQMKMLSPRFQSLAEGRATGGMQKIQSKLKGSKTALLEYFAGEDNYFLVAVFEDKAQFFRIPNGDHFQQQVQAFINYFASPGAISSAPTAFFENGYSIYNLLFSKNLQREFTSYQELIIVPDGVLNFVPFDALLTASFSGKAFAKAPFFIKKHLLRYAWSANLLDEEHAQQYGKIAHFSPGFMKGERGLAALHFGSEETKNASAVSLFEAEEATAEAFLTAAKRRYLFHLSTHAEAADEPRIEFYDSPLLLPQLYAMLIQSDLVVLSACETGLGNIAKGEGVLSLARGFAYAGANSLIASQWKVNEQSTASIFSNFYQNLDLKMRKAAALREAKLACLNNAPTAAMQSPYYWAGFVFFGNDGVVTLNNSVGNLLWVALFVALAIGTIWRLRKWTKETD